MTRRNLATHLAVACVLIGAIATAAASAELPAILLLAGKGVTSLEGTFENKEEKGAVSVLESLGKQSLTSTRVIMKWKGCLPLEGKELDTNLCHENLLLFRGVKLGAASCRSENSIGEKDPLEEVLMKVDAHLADEKTTNSLLVPLLILKLKGVKAAEEEVTVNCAAVKVKIKGRVGCLMVPGLKEILVGEEYTLECEQANGDQITGKCEETPTLCKELEEDPLKMNFNAGGFEMAGLEFNPSLKGTFNVDAFIDD